MRIAVTVGILTSVAEAEDKRPVPMPADIIIGRHTYIDVGPPFDFYEIISLHTDGAGTSIERLTLTPPGNTCLQPATVKRASVFLRETITSLLMDRNPCLIPERQLKRERERRAKNLVFSGADVVMQVTCSSKVRRLEMEILDRDLFDAAPATPKTTSWTLRLLRRITAATGPSVLDRRLISIPEESASALPSSVISDEVSRGEFDSLFGGVPDKLSTLWADAQKPHGKPSIELQSDSSLRPLSLKPLRYPDLALVALADGRVAFELTVAPDATVSDVRIVHGHPLFDDTVLYAAKRWTFPPEAVGQAFQGVVEFKTNCGGSDRP
ncbi:MAG: TonB family protein [Polyangiaceae bacterium]|nr:TonB family protein [Polyangiaceae bacterium]